MEIIIIYIIIFIGIPVGCCMAMFVGFVEEVFRVWRFKPKKKMVLKSKKKIKKMKKIKKAKKICQKMKAMMAVVSKIF